MLVIAQSSVFAQTEGAADVLARLLGKRAADFKLELVPRHSEKEFYEVHVKNNRVHVSGNSQVALTYGAYSYLKEINAALVTWEHTSLRLPKEWPARTLNKTYTPFKYRFYLNVCAFGYSTPWWNWKRWEKEIDWMALHGINMPTAMMGQEFVWQQLWKEFGLNQAELNKHMTGPAFLPWHRMGNINLYAGPLPQSYINQAKDFQLKALSRMRALGMHPVVPAFSGYVPEAFMNKNPEAKIYKMGRWSGVDKAYRTYWMDPKDPWFSKIAKRFIELYKETYGDVDHFLADAFNEMNPPVTKENKQKELQQYGERIYQSIQAAAPNATWVMQGWMFGSHKSFWSKESMRSFLSKVPEDKIFIQDFGNDRYEGIWKKSEAFFGKQWGFGYVHNYGAVNPVFGDFELYNKLPNLLQNEPVKNIAGYGVLPEGIENNSAVYEMIYDMAWKHQSVDVKKWMNGHFESRYGKMDNEMAQALETLHSAAYKSKYWWMRTQGGWGSYLHCKTPRLDYSFKGHPTDIALMEKAVRQLLACADKYKNIPEYKYDLAMYTSHLISMKAGYRLDEALKAYMEGDRQTYLAKKTIFLDGLKSMEGIIAYVHNNSLYKWAAAAEQKGTTKEEKAAFRKNALAQITVWDGYSLKGYASKDIHGIYANYYIPRMNMFFNFLEASEKPLTQKELKPYYKKLTEWDIEWTTKSKMKKERKAGNLVKAVAKIMNSTLFVEQGI